MFLDFYNLREQPFGVTPNPRYLYESPCHREALACLCYAVESNVGFAALTGKPGTGKTSVLFELLRQYNQRCPTSFVFHTQCSSNTLLRMLLKDFGLDTSERDPLLLVEQLKEFLITESRNGRRPLVVIDEAQNLDTPTLETIRLLSNLETADSKLLNVILSGQLQFARKLQQPELEQLRQRIAVAAHIAPLSETETSSYISHRLRVAGFPGGRPLFTSGAVAMIAAHSRGVPREINRLCFQALSLGCALRQSQVDEATLSEVQRDLQIITVRANSKIGSKAPTAAKGPGSVQPTLVSHPPTNTSRPETSDGIESEPRQSTPTSASRTQPGPRPYAVGTQSVQSAAARAPEAQVRPIETSKPSVPPPEVSPIRRETAPRANSNSLYAVPNRNVTHAPADRQSRPRGRPVLGNDLNYRTVLLCAALFVITAGVAALLLLPGSMAAGGEGSGKKLSGTPEATDSPRGGERQPQQSTVSEVSSVPLKPHKEQASAPEDVPSHESTPLLLAAEGTNAGSVPRRSVNNEPDPPVPNVGLIATDETSLRTILGTNKSPENSYALVPSVAPSYEGAVSPRAIKQIAPVYPAAAKAARITGIVVLDVTIGKDGSIVAVHVINGSPILAHAAVEAVKGWKYAPATIHGVPVEMSTQLRFKFTL